LWLSAARTVESSAFFCGGRSVHTWYASVWSSGVCSVDRLRVAGGLQAGDLTVSSQLVWSAGGLSGVGTTTLGASATGSFSGGSIDRKSVVQGEGGGVGGGGVVEVRGCGGVLVGRRGAGGE